MIYLVRYNAVQPSSRLNREAGSLSAVATPPILVLDRRIKLVEERLDELEALCTSNDHRHPVRRSKRKSDASAGRETRSSKVAQQKKRKTFVG
jgi:hypothetical protein